MPPAIDVYQAIADPTRRQILDLLGDAELPVNDLAAPFAMSRPAISQHLRVLREAGLVTDRKRGRQRLYRLQAEPLREVEAWLGHYRRFWHGRLRALSEYLESDAGDAGESKEGEGS